MKKLLGIVVLGLLLSGNAFSGNTLLNLKKDLFLICELKQSHLTYLSTEFDGVKGLYSHSDEKIKKQYIKKDFPNAAKQIIKIQKNGKKIIFEEGTIYNTEVALPELKRGKRLYGSFDSNPKDKNLFRKTAIYIHLVDYKKNNDQPNYQKAFFSWFSLNWGSRGEELSLDHVCETTFRKLF